MLRASIPALLVLALLASVVAAGPDDVEARPVVLDPAARGVGRLVADLPLATRDGRRLRLSAAMGEHGVVVAMTNATCPVCRRYAPRLARLEATLEGLGFGLVLVNSSPQETDDVVRDFVARHEFTAPYVHDRNRAVARALEATSTAEAFVIDRTRTLAYRGAVDDQYGVGWARERPERTYLLDAVRAVTRGERPAVEATSAPGCVLALAAPARDADDAPTWHGTVERIVQRRCQVCHRPGEAAPFPLLARDDLLGNAGMVRWVVENRRMPPWNAGPDSLPMANDASLTDDERRALLAWLDAGGPAGDPAHAPLPRRFARGWKIGEPDAVVEIPAPLRVPAEGVVPYRYVNVETDFGEDRWVRALEVRPTAPEVVHHVLVFVRYPKDHPRRWEQPRVRGGLDGYFAAMVPGQGHFVLPPGTARFLPRGATLRFQIHYTPNGTAATDRTRLGLVFAEGRPEHEMRSNGVFTTRFAIPPGDPDHVVRATRLLPIRARLHGFTPHMHLRGKAFRYELVLPDGERETLLDVPRYDFDWQLRYALREPLDVPAGSRLLVTARYDNSADNPNNPDPSQTVRFGEQTFDEMMIGYVDWHPLP